MGLFIAPTVEHYNVPLTALRSSFSGKSLVVGVAIFSESSPNTETHEKKLLLLQRSVTEDAYPLMYEIPGGSVEDEDETIFSTVVRETMEETGFAVTGIVDSFDGFEYETRHGLALQLNFVVKVDGEEVKMNPEEHQAFAWVGVDDDLRKYPMSDKMTTVVADALKFARNT